MAEMPMEVVDVDGGGHSGWRISAEDNGLALRGQLQLQHTRLYCKEDSWPDRNAKRNIPEVSVCKQTCKRLVWAHQHFEHVGCTCRGSKGATEVYRHLYLVNRLHWWVVWACKHWWCKNRAQKHVEPVDIASACVLKVKMAGRWCKNTYRGVRYHQNMAKQELEDMKPTWACWRCERACWRVEQVQEREKWWCWWWMRWWCQPNMGTTSCRDSMHAPCNGSVFFFLSNLQLDYILSYCM